MTGKINKTIALLIGAYLLVFVQSHWQVPRLWLGFQPDLTPALLVCAIGLGAHYLTLEAVTALNSPAVIEHLAVSYTHLTLPTKA